MKLCFAVVLTYTVPFPISVAAFAVVGMSRITLSKPHLKSATVVVAADAVAVKEPTQFSFPSRT